MNNFNKNEKFVLKILKKRFPDSVLIGHELTLENEQLSVKVKVPDIQQHRPDAYNSQKEFVLLIREKPAESRFPSGQVKQYAMRAVDIIKSSKNIDIAMEKIYFMCKDMILAYELAMFTPEIYTQAVLDIEEPDYVYICRGGVKTPVKRSIIRDYGYIESAVREYIFKTRPNGDENLKIMGFSSKLEIVHKLILQGSKIENIRFEGMYYNVPDYFEIR